MFRLWSLPFLRGRKIEVQHYLVRYGYQSPCGTVDHALVPAPRFIELVRQLGTAEFPCFERVCFLDPPDRILIL